jgi:hypothetical protein
MRFSLLEINLSTQEKKVYDVTEDIRKYLGGEVTVQSSYGIEFLKAPIRWEKKISFTSASDRSRGSWGL